jgi:nicotinamide riboside kinase
MCYISIFVCVIRNFMKKTKIINLYGGAGVGKSTTAAKIYNELQMNGYECDLPYEFPKQVAWENNRSQISDQLFIFAGQHRNIVRSYGKVDYIILDSPILLSLVYKNLYNEGFPASLYGNNFDRMALDVYRGYDNINFFIQRNVETYVDEGRLQTHKESIMVDNEIEKLLLKHDIDYIGVPQTKDIGDKISQHIMITNKIGETNDG